MRRLGICQYRHTTTAASHKSAWISLSAIVADTEKEKAFASPRSSELNLDNLFFRSFRPAAKYCSLFESDLNHLHGVEIVQAIPIYRVGGSVSRTNNAIASFGVLLLLS